MGQSALSEQLLKSVLESDHAELPDAGFTAQDRFLFQTLEEVHTLAFVISRRFPDPERVILGLSEIMVNAVEHGNLGISHDEKTELLREHRWQQVVEERVRMEEHRNKHGRLLFQRSPTEIRVVISDCGAGFDWVPYLEIDPSRLMNPNGRGIALARLISFDELKYEGNGNTVMCRVML